MNKGTKILLAVALVFTAVFFVTVLASRDVFIVSRFNRDSSAETKIIDNSSQGDESQADDDSDEPLFYDTAPISQAYLSGKTDSLDSFQMSIYTEAVSVIEKIVSADMTPYQQELAVHDYLVYNCTYDKKALSPIVSYTDNSDNPFGTLITGQAICKGYSVTFQMFMDMLEIPCKIIYAADTDGDEHAWNMVELDGEWYYVDVTWDDPVPDYGNRAVIHSFFNQTEEDMADRHVWDSVDLPTAGSVKYSYFNQTCNEVNDNSQAFDIVKNAKLAGAREVCLYFDESMGKDYDEYDLAGNSFMIDKGDVAYELVQKVEEEICYVNCRRVRTEKGIALVLIFI